MIFGFLDKCGVRKIFSWKKMFLMWKLAAQAHAASAPGDMLKPHECCGLVRFGSCDILDLMGCATCSNVQWIHGIDLFPRGDRICFWKECTKLIGHTYYCMGSTFLCRLVLERLGTQTRRGTWWTIFNFLGKLFSCRALHFLYSGIFA